MSSINRDAHRSFLLENGTSKELVDQVMRLMEPFYVIAESGSYGFWPMNLLTAEGYAHRFAEVIAKLTDEEVEKVIFVSARNPFPKPEWMPVKAYDRPSAYNFCMLFCEEFYWHYDREGYELETFEFLLGEKVVDRLKEVLQESLLGGFQRTEVPGIGSRLIEDLFYFNGHALTLVNDLYENMVPYIELLPKALPLGELIHEPGTWLVLCA